MNDEQKRALEPELAMTLYSHLRKNRPRGYSLGELSAEFKVDAARIHLHLSKAAAAYAAAAYAAASVRAAVRKAVRKVIREKLEPQKVALLPSALELLDKMIDPEGAAA